MQEEIYEEESDLLENKDTGTLNDAYTFVHEIAHLFDKNEDETIQKILENRDSISMYKYNETRALLTETTAITFERLFADYLLEKTNYPREQIEQNINFRIFSGLIRTESVFTKLEFIKEKLKNGRITAEYLEGFARMHGLTMQKLSNIVRNVTDCNESFDFELKYAIAGILCPTIVKKCKEQGNKNVVLLKKFVEHIKKDEFEEALKVFDIEMTEESIEILTKNKEEQEISFTK